MMRRTYGWKRTFRFFRSADHEVRDEIRAHRAERTDRLVEAGLDPAEAARQAREQLGDGDALTAAVDATVRAAGPRARWPLLARLEWLGQDVRFAFRGLRCRPGFGITAALILGFVIAANAAVFAVVSAYLVRALPYPAADRAVLITRTPVGQPTMSSDAPVPSGLNSIEWPRRDSVLEHSAAWELDGFGLLSDGDPIVVGGAWVTAGFFPIVGARTRLGRVYTAAEVEAEAAVAVISHGLWERRYGLDPRILGRTLRMFSNDRPDDTETFIIVGVLSDDFWSFTEASDVFVPLRGQRRPVLARLAPGVTPERAALHLTNVARDRLPVVDPRWSMHVTPLQEALYGEVRPSLRVLAGGALLLLLIAGANLTVLLLIRTAGRDLELSIRSALGAGRGRIFRQLSVDGLIIALVAGAGGLLVAQALLQAVGPTIQGMIGAPVPGGDAGLRIDGRVVGWTALVTALVVLVFGSVPLVLRRSGFAGLRSGRRVGSTSSRRSQSWLVGAEVALSLTLLVGAAMLVRSTVDMGRRELGFRPTGVTVASVALREGSYPDDDARVAFFEQVLAAHGPAASAGSAAVTGVPGAPAALTDKYPFGLSRGERFAARGVDPALTDELRAIHHVVSESYFEVLGILIVAGRGFTAADGPGTEPVIVVSRSLADRLWPGRDALSQYVRTGSWDDLPDEASSPWRQVVGVADDVRTTRTDEDWPDTYVPFRQRARSHMHVLLGSAGADGAAEGGAARGAVVARLREVVLRLDDRQPITVMSPLEDMVYLEMRRPRFLTGLLLAFAVFALGLALVGLHAVVSYAASQRRREVAIRLALGASRSEVDRLLVRGGLRAAGAGAGAGLVLATIGGGLLESQLYGIPALQPVTYALVTVLALGTSLLAVWITARRAGSADPAVVLREE